MTPGAVLLTGASGQLGRELVKRVPDGWSLCAADRSALDITNVSAVHRRVRELAPTCIINAAAYTAVDRAESEPALAMSVNAEGAGNVAAAGADIGARVVHISTDFVFAGDGGVPLRPEDPTSPLGVYGTSKRDGEVRVLRATGERCVILRTAWLYGAGGRNFVSTMLRLMRERGEVRVVDDQIGTPTWAGGLAAAIWRLVERPEITGVHHWTDAGAASWYDFAVAIAEEGLALGLLESAVRVRPIRSVDYPTPARRPSFSVLEKSQTWAALDDTPVHWREQLRAMLREVRASA